DPTRDRADRTAGLHLAGLELGGEGLLIVGDVLEDKAAGLGQLVIGVVVGNGLVDGLHDEFVVVVGFVDGLHDEFVVIVLGFGRVVLRAIRFVVRFVLEG